MRFSNRLDWSYVTFQPLVPSATSATVRAVVVDGAASASLVAQATNIVTDLRKTDSRRPLCYRLSQLTN